KRASKIIEGVVIKAELIPTPGFDRTVKYTFKIDKIYKGKTGKVLSVFTSAESATCGTTFDVGSKYVVLVEKNNQVGLCGAQEKWYDSKWKNRIDIQQNGLLQELRK
ncbi:MAG TPA: hypothetical protein ENJ60_04175, partial [Aeromonadales bacterium]|nr:hypothetical protein [Aeromonadales bacterium]